MVSGGLQERMPTVREMRLPMQRMEPVSYTHLDVYKRQTLKRMMAYQKKAEQMVSRKRMNHHMIRKG